MVSDEHSYPVQAHLARKVREDLFPTRSDTHSEERVGKRFGNRTLELAWCSAVLIGL